MIFHGSKRLGGLLFLYVHYEGWETKARKAAGPSLRSGVFKEHPETSETLRIGDFPLDLGFLPGIL